ncbi:MAG TPA: IS21-like element helper ATPase IstB, partial [Gemmatimonadaceae bacterium]|nr:IS21-like element helper ATPase IstB [Gemmatimonadaceae bacterium]
MLKSLRLSGILESLELRNRGAIDAKLSYVEFLAQLVEDEVERRAQHKLKMRLRRAAFDPQKTLETFDFSACPKVSQKEIADLATCRFIEAHQNVFFVGPSGVGKSHLAQDLGHEACRRGYEVVFMPAARALAQLGAGRADGTYERRLASFARPDLLILDDFGLKPLRAPAPEDLYEIVSERYEKGSMIITSNRAFPEWPEVFGEPLLASAALDRLA